MDKKLEIKFAHHFVKLPFKRRERKDRYAWLLQVFKIHFNDLSEEFIDHDTFYIGKPERITVKGKRETTRPLLNYELPKTNLLLLVLFDFTRQIVFLTCRRWSKEKEGFYNKNIGRAFEIVVKEEV